jgi:hypothetical protein
MSTLLLFRSALFCYLMQSRMVFCTDVSEQTIGPIKGSKVIIFRGQAVPCTSWTAGPFKMGPVGYPETSVRNCHSTLRRTPEELHLIHIAAEA